MALNQDYDLIFEDEDLFWNIVSTKPDLTEARDMLISARNCTIELKNEADILKKYAKAHSLNALLAKINAELKRINIQINEQEMRAAVLSIWGQEGLKMVNDYVTSIRCPSSIK